ncbi:MAG: glycosyltransferase [Bernardetiaceae bacterium]
MNILLTALGTRGDIEPFLALGALLSERGHRMSYPARCKPSSWMIPFVILFVATNEWVIFRVFGSSL